MGAYFEETKLIVSETQLSPEAVTAQSVVMLVIYLLAIVVGIYFLTKFIAKKSLQRGMHKPDTSGKKWFASNKSEPGRLLGVVDRIAVDRDKTITVVEFNGKYYMLGITGQEIRLLDTVPAPPHEEEPAVSASTENVDINNNGAEGSAETDEAAFYTAHETSFGEYIKQLGATIKLRLYKFFYRGKTVPQKFEVQLKQKIETAEQEQTKSGDNSKE